MKDAKIFTKEQIQDIENKIGYVFNNEALLEQAFIRSNYANEHKGEQSNEVLEYYGDRALEIVVTKEFVKRFGEINEDGRYETVIPQFAVSPVNEGYITDMRNRLVCANTLFMRMEELELTSYTDFNLPKSKEGHLVCYGEDILADFFEAICGAIALDCNWDMEVLQKTLTNLLDFDVLFKNYTLNLDSERYFINWYKGRFGKYPDYHIDDQGVYESFDRFYCEFEVVGSTGNIWFSGRGNTVTEAKEAAVRQAYTKLFEEDEIFEIEPDFFRYLFKDSWMNPTLANAINVLQEMEQNGLIKNVVYDLHESGNDENGNPLWEGQVSFEYAKEARGHISASTTSAYFPNKTDLKKHVALSAIHMIFEDYNIKYNPTIQ